MGFLLFSIFSFLTAAVYHINGAVVRCPGNHGPGERVVSGRYWYECSDNGVLFPRGCLNDARKEITIGDSYVINGYIMQCQLSSDLRLEIVQSGCEFNEHRYQPEDTWQDEKFWYTCARRADESIVIDVSGCVLNGTRLSLNDKRTTGLQIWQCQKKADGSTGMCTVGCSLNGREYTGGQEFQDNEKVYQCANKAGGCAPIIVACLDDSQRRIQPGQTFHRNNAIYQCLIQDNAVEFKLQGCALANGVEHRIGDTWTEGDFMWQCLEKDKKALASQVRCITSYRQLEPGCLVMDGDQATGCRKMEDGSLRIERFPSSQFSLAVTYKLTIC